MSVSVRSNGTSSVILSGPFCLSFIRVTLTDEHLAMNDVAERSNDPAPWRSYKERVAGLSQRIVEAQRPIRVLQAVQWPLETFEAFKSSGWKEMPRVGKEEYQKAGIGFDPEAKLDEFKAIENDV